MKGLTHSLAAKTIAAFLFVIFTFGFISGMFGIYCLAIHHFYGGSVASVKDIIFEKIAMNYAGRVFYEYYPAYINKSFNLKSLESDFSADNTNFRFVLKNEKGETVLGNYAGEETRFSRTFYYYKDGDSWYEHEDGYPVYQAGETFTMDCYVVKTLTSDDRFSIAEYWIQYAYSKRYALIAVTLSFLPLVILLFAFLMYTAGHRSGRAEVVPSGIDKIPYDALLAVLFIIGYILIIILWELFYSAAYENMVLELGIAGVSLLLCIPLFLLACMSFATRYKLGGWWKNTIIYRLLSFIYRVLCKTAQYMKYLFLNLPLLWQAILVLLVLSVAEFIVIATAVSSCIGEIILFFWLLEKLILVPAVLYAVFSLKKLRIGSQKIADGDLDYRIDTRHLFWDFKRHGENLNNISAGMSKAVEERMKSERFKTELITNVSHDIKTPLTSIINYVNLIKREEIEEERLKEYISVLDRQSLRLKKLVDDLVEASKASTGNLPVDNTPTEAGVLLTQSIGEYEERFKERGLELILNKPEEEIYIMADGRLLWRVFDNLMNNICKYSQPGTRAYLSLEKIKGHAVITFRNISKYMLNITSEELLERFVRGDSARTTEGSGLGLSIAKNLVELQNGKLDLIIDGDLFKAVLTFQVVQ